MRVEKEAGVLKTKGLENQIKSFDCIPLAELLKLMCLRIIWGFCESADSESVPLWQVPNA